MAFLLLAGAGSALGDTDVLDARFIDVRAEILKTTERTGVVSVVVAVAKDGEIVWEEGFGWADRKAKIAATPNTVYHLASISKSMTATALTILVERGLVDLDKPANDYLGESKLSALVGSADEATVRQLVFHKAGLPTHWNLLPVEGQHKRPGMEESISRYGILVTAPGETYTYSNFGYGVIDYIISRVSGRDYADFMREEVFEPLGMTRTWVQVDGVTTDDVAKMYDASGEVIPPYDFDHRGASAVLSSVHDLVRFGMFHLGNDLPDQQPILKDETLERIHSEVGASFSDLIVASVDYLLSSFAGVDYGGYHLLVTSGGMPGVVSRLVLCPSENIAVATIANGSNIELWPIERRILSAMLPDFGDDEANEEAASDEGGWEREPPPAFRRAWSGEITTYAGPQAIDIIFHDNGRVSLKIEGEYTPPVGVRTPLGETGFKDGTYRELFVGRINTPDATRAIHAVLIECRLQDRRLVGTASAVSMNEFFCLPYRMVLIPTE
jgi:CubicO group peptidase (beta-lactamase class C family)